MNKNPKPQYVTKEEADEMIENALRRHNRRSTIISSVLGWILIGGYSFGYFKQYKTFRTFINFLISGIFIKVTQQL